MRYLRFLCALVATLLAACGGGGGSPGATSSGGNSGTTAGTPTVTLTIVNASNAVVTSVTVGGGFQARATVRSSSGSALANTLVTFSLTDSAIATLSQTTALTDASGVASVPIAPASITAVGAATLTATVTATSSTGTSATGTGRTDFAVTAAGLSLSPISVGSTSLASGGNTTLSVTALINSVASTGTPVNVSFSTSCGQINGLDTAAGGVGVTTNGSGVASAAYTSVNKDGTLCSGAVNITATSVGATTRTAVLTVAAPVANAINFVSATPAQIFVAGSGSVEQSIVLFKVSAAAGTALPGVSVVFSIQTNPGGVGLNASGSTSNVTVTTDQAGQASVSVFSGTIPGPVKVRAALVSSPTVFAESQNLTIASGPPSQRFMSLSVATGNIEGWKVDGTSTTLTARIADRQGNAVADGTVVNFTTEGGQVANSCATTTVNKISSCSVNFISQNPRPAGGRVSVLAYLAGSKDYDDNNQNNIYDAGDTLKQQGDAYRDDNENNVFDVSEFVVPRGGVLTCTGAGGAFPSKADTCDAGLSTTVRQMAVLLFSSSSPVLTDVSSKVAGISFRLGSAENPLLPMPAGTTVAATPLADGCTVVDIAGSPVVNVLATPGVPGEDLKTAVAIGLKGCAAGQGVNVKVTSPNGLSSVTQMTLQ